MNRCARLIPFTRWFAPLAVFAALSLPLAAPQSALAQGGKKAAPKEEKKEPSWLFGYLAVGLGVAMGWTVVMRNTQRVETQDWRG